MSETPIEYLDRAPAGCFALAVAKIDENSWGALMIDVPPDQLQRLTAFLYVDPDESDEYPVREAWLRVPGQHVSKEAAWDALQDMLATRH